MTVEGVTNAVRDRPLIRSDVAGRPMATTKEMLALETLLIYFARHGRGAAGRSVTGAAMFAELVQRRAKGGRPPCARLP